MTPFLLAAGAGSAIPVLGAVVVPLICVVVLIIFTVLMPALKRKISSDTETQLTLVSIQKAVESSADSNKAVGTKLQNYMDKSDERYFVLHEDVALLKTTVLHLPPNGGSRNGSNGISG